MKKYDIPALLNLLGIPVLTIVLGLILLLNPDSAAALVGKVLAWILILVGLGFGVQTFLGDPVRRGSRGIWAVVCLAIGIWFLIKPLFLAESIGRVLGVFLLLQGGRDLAGHIKFGRKLTPGLVIAAVTALFGLVLLLMPLATSRMIFSICGAVLICIGGAEVYDRLRGRKYLDDGDDSDIVDAL